MKLACAAIFIRQSHNHYFDLKFTIINLDCDGTGCRFRLIDVARSWWLGIRTDLEALNFHLVPSKGMGYSGAKIYEKDPESSKLSLAKDVVRKNHSVRTNSVFFLSFHTRYEYQNGTPGNK